MSNTQCKQHEGKEPITTDLHAGVSCKHARSVICKNYVYMSILYILTTEKEKWLRD